MLRSSNGLRRLATRSQKHVPSLARQARPRSRTYATIKVPEAQEPTELDEITQLSNGVRVATEALPGHFSGVGIYMDAGSRFENDGLRGVSHIVDRLAFKSTKQRSADEMFESLESLGGNIQCASSRETLMYQSATFNSAVPSAVGILAETIRDPLIPESEVGQQLETAAYEIDEIWSKPDLILPELVHVAAYKDNTLGNPLLCPRERLGQITKSTVDAYRQAFYKPERMVVAFTGVNHADAVELTSHYFGDMKSDPPQTSTDTSQLQSQQSTATSIPHPSTLPSSGAPQEPSRLMSKIPFFKNLSTSASQNATVLDTPLSLNPQDLNLEQPSHYTGGFLSLPPLPPPPNPALPRLSYIHLSFEALPISSSDIYALATLQTLLGGGGSFSAGGPGKGMYSRLYTNVLNQHGWVESCSAFNHSYTDSGLFGISAACTPDRITQMLEVMCRELQALALENGYNALQHEEVERAKNQLRSSLLMNLESRMVQLEDLGRQVQIHGKKVGVKEMCRLIENLTIKDLRRVAGEVVKGLVQNPGRGTGAPTVVLQEGEEEGRTLRQLQWGEVQERIGRWELGRR
ncbi:MAG: Mitochondrial-processing peptidase subunit alpha [Chrysothrix sp. TS-e1954]|nr:MAG: Mitochondrial-processing peptidase subunit alpha [Chrysothrix sp. TS-e1954]